MISRRNSVTLLMMVITATVAVGVLPSSLDACFFSSPTRTQRTAEIQPNSNAPVIDCSCIFKHNDTHNTTIDKISYRCASSGDALTGVNNTFAVQSGNRAGGRSLREAPATTDINAGNPAQYSSEESSSGLGHQMLRRSVPRNACSCESACSQAKLERHITAVAQFVGQFINGALTFH